MWGLPAFDCRVHARHRGGMMLRGVVVGMVGVGGRRIIVALLVGESRGKVEWIGSVGWTRV